MHLAHASTCVHTVGIMRVLTSPLRLKQAGCVLLTAGAIYANDTSNITVLDSFFENNGGGQGGAIALWNSSLVVNGTEFTGNSGRSAGWCPGTCACLQTLPLPCQLPACLLLLSPISRLPAAFPAKKPLVLSWTCSWLQFVSCTQRFCRSSVAGPVILLLLLLILLLCCAGGAVAVNNGPYVQLTSSTFSGNSAENGGAVFMDSCDRTSISGNTFTQNKANKSGGGIFQNKGSGAHALSSGQAPLMCVACSSSFFAPVYVHIEVQTILLPFGAWHCRLSMVRGPDACLNANFLSQ